MQDIPHPARMIAGYFNAEFHQEPGSKELHFASIPDCALMIQDIPHRLPSSPIPHYQVDGRQPYTKFH